jgi:hypothetical protein
VVDLAAGLAHQHAVVGERAVVVEHGIGLRDDVPLLFGGAVR